MKGLYLLTSPHGVTATKTNTEICTDVIIANMILELIVAQLVKTFPAFMEPQDSNTMFTRARPSVCARFRNNLPYLYVEGLLVAVQQAYAKRNTTLCRLSVTAYSKYKQLASISGDHHLGHATSWPKYLVRLIFRLGQFRNQ